MNIEEKVKMNLLTRGFDNKTQLNNRGLIGATIDETILEVVKNLRIADVSSRRELLIDFCSKVEETLEMYGHLAPNEAYIDEYLKGN